MRPILFPLLLLWPAIALAEPPVTPLAPAPSPEVMSVMVHWTDLHAAVAALVAKINSLEAEKAGLAARVQSLEADLAKARSAEPPPAQ